MVRASVIGFVASAVLSAPLAADELPKAELVTFLGGHGCTLGPDSTAAAISAGFSDKDVLLVASVAQAEGVAKAQGQYIVFDAGICTIRLPDIQSDVSVSSPEIMAIAPYIRDEYDTGSEVIVTEGCFLQDAERVFELRPMGDADVANARQLDFLAANIISGDLRFHAPTLVSSPFGFQVTSGECARAPNLDAVAVSYPFIASGFGDYIRRVGSATPCGEGSFRQAARISADIQGGDISQQAMIDPTINAWLYFEWEIITYAAGWYEGMSAISRGMPRPPLCHYP